MRDSSGGIEGVERDVTVKRDTSGGIRVRGVGGDFSVARDGSGGIRDADVEGRIDTPERKR